MSEFVPFVGVPTYNGQICAGTHSALVTSIAHHSQQYQQIESMSLLAYVFNKLYAKALNLRAKGVTHFVMLHADVQPLGDWIGDLYRDMNENQLDVLSAVIPIKDESGETSTAVDFGSDGRRERLRVGEIHLISDADYPDENTLLINTGCLMMDIRKPWADEFAFSMRDGIGKDKDGNFVAYNHSEDWEMSRWLKARGIPYGATANIRCLHYGGGVFKSWSTEPVGV